MNREAYPDLAEFHADIARVYREELQQLGDAGCRYVQLDDTNFAFLCDPKLADTYRRAYQRNDRTWLHQESQRDPEQFLRVAQKLGVQRPPEAVAPTVAPSSSPAPTPPGPETQVPGPAGQVLSQLLGPMMAPPPAGLQPSSPPSPGLAGPVAAPLVGP